MNAAPLPSQQVDLSNCDREPIHVLGKVQRFGFLVAVSADWLIARTSDNVGEFLGVTHSGMIGRPLADFFTHEAIHDIRNRLTILRGPDAVERLFSLRLRIDLNPFDVAVHFAGGAVVIEAEPSLEPAHEAAGMVRSMMSRLSQSEGLQAFFREGARQVRALTEFDRVMVYRFDQAGSGEVVAEALRGGVDSFLGLNYPASDIPAQARVLYLRNTFRIIADVNSESSPILPGLDAQGSPLDQSLSVLRAVSPIHLEYLRNMGVEASLSISIVVEGRLWGLFACHHYKPRLPSFAKRSAAELFGQMFSMMLESRERKEASEYENRARRLAERLMASLAQNDELLNDPEWLGEIISDSIPADGVAVTINGRTAMSGLTPDATQFSNLVQRLNLAPVGQIFTTDHISELIPEGSAYAARAAGFLAIPVSRLPRDYVLLFRAERLRSVRWAGNPQDKKIEFGPNGPRLTPRKSFEVWSELVKGRAQPFKPIELRVAETLRVAVLEVVLRLSESAIAERHKAHERQELLIAELNHRVRNILSLIRGLISQTRGNAQSTEDFTRTLEDRIQALARAHDQLTTDRWGPASLTELIATEGNAYLGAKRGRLVYQGPNILIEPAAFTVLALVFHELMTNAVKYGALSDSGTIVLNWRLDPDNSLLLEWRESGGPAVTAPTRRGFGSKIIEHSIPLDLGGKADLRYRLAGLEADFCIPSRHIGPVLAETVNVELDTQAADPPPSRPLADKTVLLMEDSMIIALDCEDILRELGAAHVSTAAGVVRALEILASSRPDVAILDFNLGSETSLPVAERLKALQVPFIFATGYGDSMHLPARLLDIPVVKKPYNRSSLQDCLAQLAVSQAT